MAGVAIRYMDLLPYVDRVWFGEMFDYGGPPDYWLVEISGIPFGLMGEMIGGCRFRGLVYGMVARLRRSTTFSPRKSSTPTIPLPSAHTVHGC